jgi:hypothetical protein
MQSSHDIALAVLTKIRHALLASKSVERGPRLSRQTKPGRSCVSWAPLAVVRRRMAG